MITICDYATRILFIFQSYTPFRLLKHSCRHIDHVNDTIAIDSDILLGDNLDDLLGDKTS